MAVARRVGVERRANAFTQLEWVRALRRGKPVYRLLELARLSGHSPAATRRAVHRLVERGLLVRIGKGLYANPLTPGGAPTVETVAALLYPPAYISLESALFLHGIMDQAPYVLTCVTANKTKRFETGIGEIHYHHLKAELFFGYELQEGVPVAAPEKAALDFVYLEQRAGRQPVLDEWNWEEVDRGQLWRWAKRYPRTVQRTIEAFAGP